MVIFSKIFKLKPGLIKSILFSDYCWAFDLKHKNLRIKNILIRALIPSKATITNKILYVTVIVYFSKYLSTFSLILFFLSFFLFSFFLSFFLSFLLSFLIWSIFFYFFSHFLSSILLCWLGLQNTRLCLCRGLRLHQWVSQIWHKTIWWWGSRNAGLLRNVEYPFIAIALRST